MYRGRGIGEICVSSCPTLSLNFTVNLELLLKKKETIFKRSLNHLIIVSEF